MADSPAIARRRRLYKPAEVDVLLVGESAPAGGSHFYLANSNLFRGVRQAFVEVYGVRTPEGEAFLRFFQEHGYWLVDLANEPVNRLDIQPRRLAVERGVQRVAKTIREARPTVVVVVKKSIARQAAAALDFASHSAEFVTLPFPAMGWQSEFANGLAKIVRRRRRVGRAASSRLEGGTL